MTSAFQNRGRMGGVSRKNVLTKTNTTEFTPTANYHPSTMKYVDDSIVSVSFPVNNLTATGNQNILAGRTNIITPSTSLVLTPAALALGKGSILVINNGYNKITFGGTLRWVNNTIPTLQVTGKDVIQFISYDGEDIVACHVIGYSTEESSSSSI